MMKNKIAVLLSVCGLVFLCQDVFAGQRTNQDTCLDTSWPSAQSDLLPDPSLYRGRLTNGFRYVIKENDHPENRVAIYLNVRAGSLHEKDNQRGVAHFLEHMMFNGTSHFPSGKLLEYFHSIGMDFGGDTNAHTTYDETVYRIILPDGNHQNLDGAFLVLHDFAGGALLEEAEIDRERGVILAEKRARDTARFRAYNAANAFAFRGTIYPERLPIGLEDMLQSADKELLKSYYTSWYRPQNMVLVVVGAVSPEETEDLIRQHFSTLESNGENPECPEFGKLAHKGTEYYYHFEPELGQVSIALETLWDMMPENDSLALEEKQLHQLVGSMVMRYRLQKAMDESKFSILEPSYYSSDILNHVGYGRLTAVSGTDNWQQTLGFLVTQLRQALTYGFTEEEVHRAKKEILSYFDESVQTADSQDSRLIARRIVKHLNSNRVYQSARQEKDLYTPLVEKITTNDITDAFQEIWDHDSRLISVTGNLDLDGKGQELISKVYEMAQIEKVVQVEEQHVAPFPYLVPKSGSSKDSKTIYHPDLDIETITFANGLVLNLKQTDFDNNQFYLVANFGGGQQVESEKGASLLFSDLVNESGTSQLSRPSLDKLIAESSASLRFNAGLTSFSWRGSGLTKDFSMLCQLLHTLLLDSAARESVFNRVMNNTELLYQNLDHSIEGGVALKVRPYLANYNGNLGLPQWEAVKKNRYETLLKYLEKVKEINGLEISVAGDFDKEIIKETITKYFSGIKIGRPVENRPVSVVFPQGGRLKVEVETADDKALILIAWPTDDMSDIHRSRRLHLLAKIFEERLYNRIREKLGASYSANVTSYTSKIYEKYGYLGAKILVDPKDQELIISEILTISENLRYHGVTEEELGWSKKPMLTSLKESLKSNKYWLYTVMSQSSRNPEQLLWPLTIIKDFASTGVGELNSLARQYLDNNKAAIAQIVPVRPKDNLSEIK